MAEENENRRGDRKRDLGRILKSISGLLDVNDMLKCNMRYANAIYYSSSLRIIEGIVEGNDNKYSRVRCCDKDNILCDLPGYIEEKDLWDYWRIHTVSHRTFLKVIRGEYPNYLVDYKNQKGIEESWG